MVRIFTISLLVVSTLAPAQDKFSEKLFSPDELRLENIHPNLYANTSKGKFHQAVEELEQDLTEPITRHKFAQKLIPLITCLGDGHTSVYFPQEERNEFLNQGGKVFPFEVLIRNNRLFITANYSSNSTLSAFTEIVSINGLTTPELLNRLRPYISAELDFYRDIRIQRAFRSLLWNVLGFSSDYELELLAGGHPVKERIQGITATQFQAATAQQLANLAARPYSLYITPENLAVIDFRAMINKKSFAQFIDSAFRVIRNENIQYLAVDLRNNGGGNSQLGDMLFNYITDKPYRQVDRMEVKASNEMKAYFRKQRLKWYMYPLLPLAAIHKQARHYVFGKPGKIQVIEMKKLITPKKEPLKFRGITCLLVSHYTFSSANMLAAAFQCYNMGTLIGEETGGVLVAFGDIIPVYLPNTKLPAGCSYKKFVHPCSDAVLRGIRPDVEIIPTPDDFIAGKDAVLEYVKKAISK